MKNVDTLIADSGLKPFLHLFYIAWADGELDDGEINSICSTIASTLDGDCSDITHGWLDPNDPPTPGELMKLLGALKIQAKKLPETQKRNLADIGIALAELDGKGVPDSVRTALHKIDLAFGLRASEAIEQFFKYIPAEDIPEAAPRFELEKMDLALNPNGRAQRDKVRALLSQDVFQYSYDGSKEEKRKQVLNWLTILADAGLGEIAYPGVTYDAENSLDFVTTFQTLAEFDHSLVIKYGVQFGLWGGSIFHLGTEEHHQKYLPKVASMEIPGCFAMSETGHGSNVRDCKTTATYDVDTKSFIINTPNDMARKDWIGNAAKDGLMATVFAQLYVGDAEESYGVHAFVVPLRNEQGDVLPGIRIEDCGHKLGLNGVDNGRIWFDQVSIPKENLLNRYADVSDEGEYSSPILSSGRRFFTMLSTLVGGRVAVGAASVSAAKSALSIAIRYGAKRRQFGPAEKPEAPILNYRAHQRKLMPLLAKSYGLTFAFQYLVDQFTSEKPEADVEVLAAGLKSYATWNNNQTVQVCRECCGGQGYLSSNRFSSIRADTDIYTTFEGDNTILMLLVSKGRLSDFKEDFSGSIFSTIRAVAKLAGEAVETRNPISSRATDSETLRSAEHQLSMLGYRDDRLQYTLARRFQSRMAKKMDPFEALNDVQDHFLSLAHAHIERVILEQFILAVEREKDEKVKRQLDHVRALLGIVFMHDDIGWFMENGVVESNKSRAIRKELNALCAEVREQAVHLVDAFGIPDKLLSAPIGTGSISG